MRLPFRRPRRPLAFAITATAALVFLLFVRCASAPHRGPPTAIEACGQPFDVGTRVVRWHEPGGYDAYRRAKFFTDEAEPDGRLRYAPLRGGLPEAIAAQAAARGLSLGDLRQVVHQFVLHFDVCGTARRCFHVLHDVRNLSVHFLLDVDGTVYQTLDLREKAHHATYASDFSVGVEIAHPGTFPQPLSAAMRAWYERDEQGWFQKYPPGRVEPGVRTPGFVPRPDRPELQRGIVQGRTWYQFDFTPQQYRALAHLAAGLSRALPRIRLEVPRDAAGNVVQRALPEAEIRRFEGIVGHFHVQQNKNDPGPALQWDRLLQQARALRGGAP